MSKLKFLLTGLAFANKQLLVFMHTAQCLKIINARDILYQFMQIDATLLTTPMGLAPMALANWLFSNVTQVIHCGMMMTPSNQHALEKAGVLMSFAIR